MLIYSFGHCECDDQTVNRLTLWCLAAETYRRVSVHAWALVSFLIAFSRPHNLFSRYSNWLDIFLQHLLYFNSLYRHLANNHFISYKMVISKVFTELNQVWHRITIVKLFVIIKFPTLAMVSEFSFLAVALRQAQTTKQTAN